MSASLGNILDCDMALLAVHGLGTIMAASQLELLYVIEKDPKLEFQCRSLGGP